MICRSDERGEREMRITNQPCDSVSAPPSFSVARPSTTDVNDFFFYISLFCREGRRQTPNWIFFLFFSPFSIGSRHFPDFFFPSLDFWLTIIFCHRCSCFPASLSPLPSALWTCVGCVVPTTVTFVYANDKKNNMRVSVRVSISLWVCVRACVQPMNWYIFCCPF